MRVNSKAEYYALSKRNLFNMLRTWDGLSAWEADGCFTPIRFRSKIPGSTVFTGITYEDVRTIRAAYRALVANGADPDELIFCEPAPDHQLVIQGEIARVYSGITLSWSTEKVTNRIAMRTANQSFGLSAKRILENYLEPEDFETVFNLVDEYDGTVEFASFSRRLGNLERKMVVWEVRSTF